MKNELSRKHITLFESIKEIDENGNEFWGARKLSKVLEYSEFRHFIPVIERAKEACENSGHAILDHFEEYLEEIVHGKGAKQDYESVKLSRYACYLIVQNADPGKEVVAQGQTYFAVQTRLQEISQMAEYNRLKSEEEKRLFLRDEMKRHNIQLADAAKGAGVIEPLDYAIFQNHGYMGLYGGLDAKGIHKNKGLKKSQHILDHIGSTELAANLFLATQTEEKLRRDQIKGKQKANKTHYEIGKKVRKTIEEIGGTMPENLPVADSIKRLEKAKTPKPIKTPKMKKIMAETKNTKAFYNTEIPKDWEVKHFEDVADIDRDSLNGSTPKDYEFDYISLSDVDSDDFKIETTRQVFASAPSRARRIVKQGDILMSTVVKSSWLFFDKK
ncbi:MAG: DNA damage-inducible protein D [Bacteroidetes bacterium]|nr:DNA damage-inducible protein D [Bacteroidota bacterium]